MGKTADNIEYYLDSKNDKDYLQDLLLNIKESYTNKKNLTFKIIEPKEKGFVIKVGGLFGFVSYHHMPWKYSTINYWKNVSNYLVDKVFVCKIEKLTENPISIFINAKEQVFKKPELTEFEKYRGIVINKADYGLFVDIGFHFNWKFGSVLGLVHKSLLIDETDYENTNEGNEIMITFQGYNSKGQLILGDNRERGKWMNGELDKLIGTTQKISVVINENNESEFYVLGEYKTSIPINKAFYPNCKTSVKKYIYGLENGQIIDCEVVNINKRKDSFICKLLIE